MQTVDITFKRSCPCSFGQGVQCPATDNLADRKCEAPLTRAEKIQALKAELAREELLQFMDANKNSGINTPIGPGGRIDSVPDPFQGKEINMIACAHRACPSCHGTGVTASGGHCIHNLSCNCPRCTPYCSVHSMPYYPG